MKKINFIVLFMGFTSFLFAGDLVTKSGRVLKDYALIGAAPNGIRVMHSDGVSIVPVSQFPADLPDDIKIALKKFEKDIPAAKKRYEARMKKQKEQQKASLAQAKAQAAREKKSAALLKKDADANKKLQNKLKSSATAPKSFKKD